MRCDACNNELTDYESSFNYAGAPLNICMDCLETIEETVKEIEANANLASEADFK